jgi:RimJ/RimL family protein N-acetyltransferase
MATRPDLRGRGIGTTILTAGATWAAEQNAHRLYLQVETTNEPALRLYARAGFTRAYGYHFRIAP